jgi:hypothetical protein
MPPGVTIQDESRDGDLSLALVVEGQRTATARASADVLAQLGSQLGVTRAEVERDLRSALERLHANELEKVTVSRLREAPAESRRFVASFLHRDFRDVIEGVVWYTIPDGRTGPDDAPPLVRNKLRYEVHTRLVGENKAAGDLLKAVR